MRDRNTGTQPNSPKKCFLNVEFCRRKTVVLTFFAVLAAHLQRCQKSINDVTDIWAIVTWYAELRSRDTHIFCWIMRRLLCVFETDIALCCFVLSCTRLHGSVTSVVRATPHTKRGAYSHWYSIVNGDRCSASHCNYQNRIRSVRIFANCLSAVISFNSTMLVTSAIRTALRLNNINVKNCCLNTS